MTPETILEVEFSILNIEEARSKLIGYET